MVSWGNLADRLEQWASSRYAEFNAQKIFKVLEPEPGTGYSEFVSAPTLAQDPAGGNPFFLFVGTDVFKDDEDIFLGRMDEKFNITGVERLIAHGYPSADWTRWFGGPSLLYDGANEEWLLAVTGYYDPIDDTTTALFRFSKDFSEEVDRQAPMQVDGGDWWSTEKTELLPCGGKAALALSEFHGRHRVAWTGDFTATLPTWSEQTYSAFVGQPVANPEAPSLVGWGASEAVGLLESHFGAGQRALHPVYLWYDASPVVAGERAAVGGVGSDPVLGNVDPSLYRQIHRPHLTTLPDGRYNLFYSSFLDRSFEQPEIRAIRIPRPRLNPRDQRALTYTLWRGDSIAAGDTTFPMPAYGRKTFKFESDTSGDLSVEMWDNDVFKWFTLDTFAGTTEEIRMTEYSAGLMRLKFSAAATVSAVVTVEPGV